jgi:hypothetical protein
MAQWAPQVIWEGLWQKFERTPNFKACLGGLLEMFF